MAAMTRTEVYEQLAGYQDAVRDFQRLSEQDRPGATETQIAEYFDALAKLYRAWSRVYPVYRVGLRTPGDLSGSFYLRTDPKLMARLG